MEKPFSGLPPAVALPKPKKAKMGGAPMNLKGSGKPKKTSMKSNAPAPMLGTYKKVR